MAFSTHPQGSNLGYLQVLIQTGRLLGEIAATLGYEVVRIDLFRTRLATATRQQLREEVVVLRWPGWRKTSWSLSAGLPGRIDSGRSCRLSGAT